jgi:hypothetical protein
MEGLGGTDVHGGFAGVLIVQRAAEASSGRHDGWLARCEWFCR